MYMKTKDQVTVFPTQKMTFLHNCRPFYTEAHVFCRNRRLFCHYSRTGRGFYAAKLQLRSLFVRRPAQPDSSGWRGAWESEIFTMFDRVFCQGQVIHALPGNIMIGNEFKNAYFKQAQAFSDHDIHPMRGLLWKRIFRIAGGIF